MATNTAGTDARLYHQSMVHYLRKTVNYNDSGVASGVSMGTIPSGSVVIGVDVLVETAFSADGVHVGVSGTPDKYVAAGDVTETSTGFTSVTANNDKVSADTEILVTVAGTQSAGKATVIFRYAPDHTGA